MEKFPMSTIRKLSKVRKADPFFARECERYEFPLPSREYVAQILEHEGRPLAFDELAEQLDIHVDEREMFGRRLGAMEREGQILKNRKGAFILPERASLIAGRVQGHVDGFGFLIPDDGSDDLFLDQHQMEKVLHGDRVLARVIGVDRKGRPEGSIVEVTERANTRVVGRVFVEHGVAFVVPENRRLSQDILIPPERRGKLKAESGQVVMVDIIEQPSRHSQPIGRITEILGNYADPGMEIEIALRKHDLPFEFSKEALAENAKIPDKVRKTDGKDREDLTGLPLVTIDGETARDFDDAVFCEKVGRNWRLVVAIADVSNYVKPGMTLDQEAYERGNSVYFPRRVIPMLPERLSNGICSLNPEVERLAMVCDMCITGNGEIKEYRFYPAVFRSHARLTYNQVWAWLDGQEKAAEGPQQVLQPHLQNLYKLFQILLRARTERGAIDFETVETQMLFNGESKIENIVPVIRNDAHRIIEECMLAANVCASDFLAEHKQPCLYRVHEGPTPEKLKNLHAFLGEVGLQLTGGDTPTAKDYAQLLEKIKLRPDAQLLQTVMLRSLRQAMYSPDNVGHFGLSYTHYTHFTSPIRRYPDLLVHRAIKAVLAGEQYVPAGAWDDIGLHCSATERRADEATRDVENWLKCYYMKERIGEVFDGSISAVTAFGIFVALDQVYVEGLVHVTELGEDYFKFDAIKHQMLGERTGKRFRLGDRLQVKLVKADLESGKIDFVLAGPTKEAGKGGGKAAAKGAGKVVGERRGNNKANASRSTAGGNKGGRRAQPAEPDIIEAPAFVPVANIRQIEPPPPAPKRGGVVAGLRSMINDFDWGKSKRAAAKKAAEGKKVAEGKAVKEGGKSADKGKGRGRK
jgi:ribonuclease R